MWIIILPKTSLGRWSIVLAIAVIILFVVFLVALPLFLEGEYCFFVWGIGLAALVEGLISVIKNREQSPLVFAGIIICILASVVVAVKIATQ